MIGVNYVLRNSGTATVERLTVIDPAVKVVCNRSSLAAGSTTACIGSRKVTLTDMNRGVIVSSALAGGVAIDGRRVTVAARSVSVALSVRTRLVIQQRIAGLVDVDRDGRIGAGDLLRYGFTVSNMGNVTLSRVAVRDAMISRFSLGVRCVATHLNPGTSTNCTAGAYTVTAWNVRRGKVANFAAATATTPSGVAVRSNSSVTVQPVAGRAVVGPPAPKPTRPPRPRIELLQWIVRIDDNNHDTLVDWGDGVVYGFRVTNSGGTPVTKIAIDAARLARSGVRVSCASQTLQPGSSVTCISGVYTATEFSMTHGVGSNHASASAVSSSGKVIHSNSTVISLPVGVSVRVALAPPSGLASPSGLAMTGSPADRLLMWAGGLIAAGLVLRLLSRKTSRLV